jgi:2-keto-4-pentenoate hydratase/2-oxohepta-3-ene-1,7-dioic acid hydratase in catechol pathway
MKLLRYLDGCEERLGLLEGGEVVDLAPLTLPALLEADANTRDRLVAAHRGRVAGTLGSLTLAPPLDPVMILCAGENYTDHLDEKPPVRRDEPEFFLKTPTAVVGHAATVPYPDVTKKLDYEVELAVVIGHGGHRIPADRALDHVFGYTIMNDLTARDRQVVLRPDGTAQYRLGGSKNFDGSAPLGPVIVTTDQIPDPQSLAMTSTINGEVRQQTTTGHMITAVAELVEFFSAYLTLRPGTVISTGTPAGTAWGSDPELGGRHDGDGDRYLRVGDEVACEIDGIGVLRTLIG